MNDIKSIAITILAIIVSLSFVLFDVLLMRSAEDEKQVKATDTQQICLSLKMQDADSLDNREV